MCPVTLTLIAYPVIPFSITQSVGRVHRIITASLTYHIAQGKLPLYNLHGMDNIMNHLEYHDIEQSLSSRNDILVDDCQSGNDDRYADAHNSSYSIEVNVLLFPICHNVKSAFYFVCFKNI